jgi:Family of unknown function (DUF6804)
MSAEQPSSAVTPAIAIATVGVLIGLAHLPYGYFMLLRFILCGISLFLLLGANLVLVDWQRWALGAFAVLYNPLLPVRIGEKSIWLGLNIATVVLFWVIRTRQPCHQEATSPVSTAMGNLNFSDQRESVEQHDPRDTWAVDALVKERANRAGRAERQRLAKANE